MTEPPSDSAPNRTLEMAHVLFMDIVAYSGLPMDEQHEVLQHLQEAVRETKEYARAKASDQLIRLPTGDGMALVFLGDVEAPVRCALELHSILRRWPDIHLRMGIHTGPVYRVEDINEARNVSGGGINIAQRVMDCGDAGHILISKSVADVLDQVSTWKTALHDLGEAEVKHGVRIHLYNLYTDEAGNRELPEKLRSTQTTAATARSQSKRKKRSLGVVATGVIAALVVGGLYYRSSQSKHLTDKDTIVLADFANSTGDPIFDDTLKNALSISLLQSPFFSVLPGTEVAKTLQQMTRPVGTKLTPEIAREVCQRVGSKAYLAGSIDSLGSKYVLGLEAVNCQTGSTLAQEQARVATKEEVLEALDKTATNLRGNLGESLSSVQKFGVRLAGATTSSLEALKLLSIGEKVQDEKGDAESVPFYNQAIDLDPNFALAYAHLGTAYQSIGEAELARKNYEKALALLDRVTQSEKYSISASYYAGVTGELGKAIQVYELFAETYPRDTASLVNLGYIYQSTGQYEKALAVSRAAIRINPATGGYENLVGYYVALNRLDEAKAAYQQALALNLDLVDAHGSRYSVAFLEGDTSEMERQVAWSKGKPQAEDAFLNAQSDTEAFSGRLRKARGFSQQAVAIALRSDLKETAARWKLNAAAREAEFVNLVQAREQTASALGEASSRDLQIQAALVLARAGDSVPAERIADSVGKRSPLDTLVNSYWLPTIRAAVEISRSQPARAVELLQATSAYELAAGGALYPVYLRGQALLMSRQGAAAAVEFQKMIDHRGIVVNSPLGALAHLGLGRAYRIEGDTLKARTAYQDFFSLWKDADPDIPIYKQAKAEYSKLQ